MARPKLSERTNLTQSEQDYCKLRASGMNIEQAAKSLNRNPGELARLEREYLPLKVEIQSQREQRMGVNQDQSAGLRLKILKDLDQQISEALIKGGLSIGDMQKAYELLTSVTAAEEALITRAEVVKEEEEKKNIPSMLELLQAPAEEDKEPEPIRRRRVIKHSKEEN